ncbi:MAG TPA: dihydropteroate synthase, partial [Candidatus Limnocylindrales bacterium]
MRPAPTRIGRSIFTWGERTFVAGIVNVTPDSFSGDGLLAGDGPGAIERAVSQALAQARTMVAEGADLLDVGGESTRPGHAPVRVDEELARTIPVLRAIRADLPDIPLSIDTTKPAVAEAGIAAGANLLNDVWGVGPDPAMARLAAAHGLPLILMHNRAEARYDDLLAEVIADLGRAIERAVAAGCALDSLIVDPGFGFGKTPEHNLEILRRMGELHVLGRPIMLGTSRKSTLGRVLDL